MGCIKGFLELFQRKRNEYLLNTEGNFQEAFNWRKKHYSTKVRNAIKNKTNKDRAKRKKNKRFLRISLSFNELIK